jgi:hypothetical protein
MLGHRGCPLHLLSPNNLIDIKPMRTFQIGYSGSLLNAQGKGKEKHKVLIRKTSFQDRSNLAIQITRKGPLFFCLP